MWLKQFLVCINFGTHFRLNFGLSFNQILNQMFDNLVQFLISSLNTSRLSLFLTILQYNFCYITFSIQLLLYNFYYLFFYITFTIKLLQYIFLLYMVHNRMLLYIIFDITFLMHTCKDPHPVVKGQAIQHTIFQTFRKSQEFQTNSQTKHTCKKVAPQHYF